MALPAGVVVELTAAAGDGSGLDVRVERWLTQTTAQSTCHVMIRRSVWYIRYRRVNCSVGKEIGAGRPMSWLGERGKDVSRASVG